jgi:hypothetical protein
METKKFSRPDDRLSVFSPRGVQRKMKEENSRQGTVSGVSLFYSLVFIVWTALIVPRSMFSRHLFIVCLLFSTLLYTLESIEDFYRIQIQSTVPSQRLSVLIMEMNILIWPALAAVHCFCRVRAKFSAYKDHTTALLHTIRSSKGLEL